MFNYNIDSFNFFEHDKFPFYLPVDIYLDNDFDFETNDHPLCILMRNGYFKENFIPISIEDNPKLLLNNKLGVFRKDLYAVFNCIKKYQTIFKKYAIWDIDQHEFISFFSNKLNENLLAINKMSIYKASTTGLKMDIWIDSTLSAEKSKHNLDRIKFQPAQGFKKSSDFVPMLVDNSQYDDTDKNIKFSSKDLNKLKEFLLLNKNNIKQLYKNEIDQTEFEAKMIVFDKNGKPVFPKEDIYAAIAGPYSYGFTKVKLKSGKYSYENKYGQLAFDKEFDEADDFMVMPNDKIGAYVKIDKFRYVLYADGKLILQGL